MSKNKTKKKPAKKASKKAPVKAKKATPMRAFIHSTMMKASDFEKAVEDEKKIAEASLGRSQTKGYLEAIKDAENARLIPNEKYGCLDAVSPEEMKEREEEATQSIVDACLSSDDFAAEEIEVRLDTRKVTRPSIDKNRYFFYIVEEVNDNDFVADTQTGDCYADFEEAKDALIDQDCGAIWEITARKVMKMAKTAQTVDAA